MGYLLKASMLLVCGGVGILSAEDQHLGFPGVVKDAGHTGLSSDNSSDEHLCSFALVSDANLLLGDLKFPILNT